MTKCLSKTFSARRLLQGTVVTGTLVGAVLAFQIAASEHVETPDRAGQGPNDRPAATTTAVAPLASIADDERRITFQQARTLAKTHLAKVAALADYTARFTKVERIDGKLLTQEMEMKFRRQPFSVYLRHQNRRRPGREVLFVAGANDNLLLVREVGLKSIVGTLSLKPDCPRVMETNRHPITEIGMAKLLESAMALWENDEREAGAGKVTVELIRGATVESTACDLIEIAHRVNNPKICYSVGRVYLDQQTGFPIQAEMYGWPDEPDAEPPLLERYTYADIKTNVGLTEADFDPRNPEYRFGSGDK